MSKHDRIEDFLLTMENGTGVHPPAYAAYFRCFNAGDYYEAHDVLEHLWLRERGPDFYYYKGLIQIAGAFVHLKKHHARPDHPKDGRRLHPAVRLFDLGIKNITPFSPRHRGLDVAALCTLCDDLASGIRASDFTVNPWSPGHGPCLQLAAG
jgi:hypothetical protein